MPYSDQDRDILRTLAARYMAHADLPVHRRKLELWKALNRGRMERPMVNIDQLPWNELMPDGCEAARISDPFWSGVGWQLCRALYQWENFPADMVLEPYVNIPSAVHNSGYGVQAQVEAVSLHPGSSAPGQRYTPVLSQPDDVQKIKDFVITHDEAESQRRLQEAEAIFGGVAPVRLRHGATSFNLGIWDFLNQVMGAEAIYIDILDRPDFIHALLTRAADAVMAGIRQANQLRVFDDLSSICHCSHTYTDELLPDFGQGKGSVSANCWAFGLAQLFTAVSPAVFEEFELPYITRMAREYGAIYYGCCDRMDDRLEHAKKIPNVRKISCSPWSDRVNFANRIGPRLVMSVKPSPTFLSIYSETAIRDDLINYRELAKSAGVNMEFILKDVSTVQFEPARLKRWAEIAMEVVDGF